MSNRKSLAERNTEKLSMAVNMIQMMRMVQAIRVKEVSEPKDMFSNDGIKTIHHLAKAPYEIDRKFYSYNLKADEVLDCFMTKGYISDEDKEMTIFEMDGVIPDIKFGDLFNIQIKEDVGFFSIRRRGENGKTRYLAIK